MVQICNINNNNQVFMLRNVKRTKQDNESYSCVMTTAEVAGKRCERTLNWHLGTTIKPLLSLCFASFQTPQ